MATQQKQEKLTAYRILILVSLVLVIAAACKKKKLGFYEMRAVFSVQIINLLIMTVYAGE